MSYRFWVKDILFSFVNQKKVGASREKETPNPAKFKTQRYNEPHAGALNQSNVRLSFGLSNLSPRYTCIHFSSLVEVFRVWKCGLLLKLEMYTGQQILESALLQT